jgi:hypothetical protein
VFDLAVLAAVVFAFGLVSRRLEETVLTAPIVFVVAGAVLGPAGLGLVEFRLDDHAVLLLGEIALALVLFTDAARINLSALRQNEGLPLRLLGIGMPLTIALGTVVAALVLTDLTFWEAAIVGTVLAPTDAALGQAVVSNPRVPDRVRLGLERRGRPQRQPVGPLPGALLGPGGDRRGAPAHQLLDTLRPGAGGYWGSCWRWCGCGERLAGEPGFEERVDNGLVPAPRSVGTGAHRLSTGRPDRGQWLHRRLRQWLGGRANHGVDRRDCYGSSKPKDSCST